MAKYTPPPAVCSAYMDSSTFPTPGGAGVPPGSLWRPFNILTWPCLVLPHVNTTWITCITMVLHIPSHTVFQCNTSLCWFHECYHGRSMLSMLSSPSPKKMLRCCFLSTQTTFGWHFFRTRGKRKDGRKMTMMDHYQNRWQCHHAAISSGHGNISNWPCLAVT